MDNPEQYIQKKLLYKFQKELDLVLQEYLKVMFPSQTTKELSNQELIQKVQTLSFTNFKYRTALLSSNKDLIHNEQELLNQQLKIQSTKEEIKAMQEQLQRAQIAKQNKIKFNQIGQQIHKYDKRENINIKMDKLDSDMNELQNQYNKDMVKFQSRQRYLRASISALKSFLNEMDTQNTAVTEIEPLFKLSAIPNNSEDMIDDGQIY